MIPTATLKAVRTIVVYDNCADGLASAILSRDVLPDAEMRFVQVRNRRAHGAAGRPDLVAFATGDAVQYAYDEETRRWVGMTQTKAGGAWSGAASTRFKMNSRGLVDFEVLGIESSAVRRTYGYSDQHSWSRPWIGQQTSRASL
jgi:hypothetical protein